MCMICGTYLPRITVEKEVPVNMTSYSGRSVSVCFAAGPREFVFEVPL